MQNIGVMGNLFHDYCLHECREEETEAVAKVKPFETNSVLDPQIARLISFDPKKDLDAHGGDHQESGCKDLGGNSNIGKGLIPFEERAVC